MYQITKIEYFTTSHGVGGFFHEWCCGSELSDPELLTVKSKNAFLGVDQHIDIFVKQLIIYFELAVRM
jgi:hypothetical protein